MNESDTDIQFFGESGCNHCIGMKKKKDVVWFDSKEPSKKWNELVEKLTSLERNRDYSCILALSGGIDSCNLAYLVKSYGIKPLVVHIDTGWNSAMSYRNLKSVLDATGWDLETIVINWEEMRQLQVAYLKSGVPNLDVPQDHAIFASLYHLAKSKKIKVILTGGNMASEGIFPSKWHHSAMDRINLYAINRTFGESHLPTFPTVSFFDYYFVNPFIRRIRTFRPLNLVGYDKLEMSRKVIQEWGIISYPQKHGESSFTSIFQKCILPERFGIDKRIAHLSAMIVSGNVSREFAIRELESKTNSAIETELAFDFLAKKLELSTTEVSNCVSGPKRNHTDFANWNKLQRPVMRAKEILARILKKNFARY